MRQSDSTGITEQEFDGIYRKYYSPLFYYAYGFVEDSEISRDIVSDVFEQAWENANNLSSATIGSYLYSCIRNKSIDYLRHDKVAQQYADYIINVTKEDEELSDEEMEERLIIVQKVISELPPRTRYVLEQCYFNNKTYKEVATLLDVSPDAVKKHIMKALSILREHLLLKGDS